MSTAPLIAGLEMGGTKCIAILATGPDDVREEVRVPTTSPDETLAALEAVLDRWVGFDGLGIACFGPLSLDPNASDYGSVTRTTKPGWAGAQIAERLRRRYKVATGLHTDVVGAALGEGRWGAAAGLADHAYVTVGTGIGVGLVSGGRPVTGMTHQELGHVRPQRMAGDDWTGICAYHGDCVEGLASGPAIAARTGMAAPDLSTDHPAWQQVAHALGQMLHIMAFTGVPRRVVMGGGVMVGMPHLFPLIRQELKASMAGYLVTPELGDMETYVVPAQLGGHAGPLGAVVLGELALQGEIAAVEPFTHA